MELLSASQFGKPRANIYAGSNALKLPAIDDATTYQKLFTATVASGKKLVSVAVAGVTYTFAETIYVQNANDVRDAIVALIKSLEVDIFLHVVFASGVLKVKYISSAVNLTAITLETAGAMTVTSTSTVRSHSRAEFSIVGASKIAYNGGAAETMANSPYAYSGDYTTDLATAADLKQDFLNISWESPIDGVQVTVNTETEKFDVSYRIATADAQKLTIDGVVNSVVATWETFDEVDAAYYSFGK